MSEVRRTDEIQGEILHEYDGIEEADNVLPRWWLGILYGSIAFGVAYWFSHHEYGMAQTQNDVHAAYVAKMAKEAAKVDKSGLAALADDTEAAASGAALFAVNCIACHGTKGEGTIGPNLTDGFWIHGGSAASIHKSITEGQLAKGMPAWGAVLGPKKVKDLTAFVLGLRGTDVAGKPPQGDPYEEAQ